MTSRRAKTAERLKERLIESSPLIEEFTARTCPGCADVCCRQKHGLYREQDILYLQALNVEVPQRNSSRPLEGACECMGPQGCEEPRWIRPFKCTWYFCDPLLTALDKAPQKRVRKLTEIMQEMIDLYDRLSRE